MIQKIDERLNIWGDNIAKVERWDFSKANISEEARIQAITTVASVCYDNPKVIGKDSLYNRLKAESMGLPSSSFEFVPVLIDEGRLSELYDVLDEDKTYIPHIVKFGELVQHEDEEYLLTNYRALLADSARNNKPQLAQWFNTEEECDIIKKNYFVFLYKMDIATSKQHVRHRVNHQELSRRYVSGKKTPFEFYFSGRIKHSALAKALTEDAEMLYYDLLKNGVQPQEARRILPQTMYTTIWSGFNKPSLDNYINLRTDKHAQWEIQQIANAMKDMIKE